MRFEVRTTGLVVILLGLAALSTVVFALGMFAGHEIAMESAPKNTQLAGVYKAPVPPAAEASPAPSPTSQAIASPAAVASPSAPVARATRAAPAKVARRRPAATPSTAKTEALPPPPVVAAAPTVSKPAVARAAPTHAPLPAHTAAEQRAAASPVATPQSVPTQAAAATPYHKPYNIQIDAVMDRKNADQMVSRMRGLGFHAILVPTDISGKIWWRVRVGPYPTKSEALAAQVRLRQQYEQAYGRGGIVGER